MNSYLLIMIGEGIGLLIAFLMFRPTKAYNDGFEAAKKIFKDKDWDDGYRSGWDGAFRQIEEIAATWNHRDERKEDATNN